MWYWDNQPNSWTTNQWLNWAVLKLSPNLFQIDQLIVPTKYQQYQPVQLSSIAKPTLQCTKHQVLWQPTKQLNWAPSMVEFLMSSAHNGVEIKLARLSFSIGMCGNWISPMIPSIGTILSHNILLLPVNIANSIMAFTRKFILPCEKDIDLRIVSAFLELSTWRRWPRFSLFWMSQFFELYPFLESS